MAEYTVTAANVQQGASAKVEHLIAAVAITAGQACYKDSTGQAKLSDCDSGTAADRAVTGIAVNDAAAGQYVTLCSYDADFTPGFTLAAGIPVAVGGTAGSLQPATDLTTGDAPMIVGVGIGSDKMILSCGAQALKSSTVI